MTHLIRTLVAACGLALLLFAGPSAQAAPKAPVIFSVSESQDTASGEPSLTLLGSRLSIFKTYALQLPDGTDKGPVTRLLRSRTMLVLGLPAGLDSGEYDLVFTYGPRRKPLTLTHRITLQNGGVLPGTLEVESLSGALETDLRDAELLGGQLPAHFLDGKWTESSGNVHRPTGRVGIGETTPASDLHVSGTAGVLFTGTDLTGSGPFTGTIPAEGAGTRMMWYPERAALRVGDVDGSHWDDANMGAFSVAVGRNTTASGRASTAMGGLTTASGRASTAMGGRNTASGGYSTAMGQGTTASGGYSTAMGQGTTASGEYSTAMGLRTSASGPFSTAMGAGTSASGRNSTTMGANTFAAGFAATAMGYSSSSRSYGSLVIGRWNTAEGATDSWVVTDPLFQAGNGVPGATRSNALTLLKNGNLTIAGTLTQNSDARFKKDIEPLDGVLSKLGGISGVTYRFQNEATHPAGLQVGLLAQQVQEAFPELVGEGPDGTLSVAYGKFTAVLLEAVHEQQEQIEARDRDIEDLQKRLARLEALLTESE